MVTPTFAPLSARRKMSFEQSATPLFPLLTWLTTSGRYLFFKTMKTVFKTMKEQWTDEKRIFLHPNVTKRRLVRLPIEKRWK